MRHAIAAVLILTALATVGATPIPEVEVPAKAKLATREYNQAITKAEATYNATVQRARSAYVRDLEAAKASYMRDRDLEGATAVQKLMDGLETEQAAPSRFVRIINNQVMPMQLQRDGQIDADGSTSWSRWKKTEGGIVINGNLQLSEADVAAFVATDANGDQVLLFEVPGTE